MSPPVVGTLIGLCIALILRSDDPDALPLPHVATLRRMEAHIVCDSDSHSDNVTADTVKDTSEVSAGPLHPPVITVGLDGMTGLYGVCAGQRELELRGLTCQLCFNNLSGSECGYLWRLTNGSSSLLHGQCLVKQSALSGLQDQTLSQLKGLLMQTDSDHPHFLASLFDVEDALNAQGHGQDLTSDLPSQSEPPPVWIKFRGEEEPVRLDSMSFQQELMLERGRPYTYVEPPPAKTSCPAGGQSAGPKRVCCRTQK